MCWDVCLFLCTCSTTVSWIRSLVPSCSISTRISSVSSHFSSTVTMSTRSVRCTAPLHSIEGLCYYSSTHTSLSSLPSAQSVYLWSVFLMSCEIFITVHLTNGSVSLTTNPMHGLQLLQYWLNQDLSASLAEFSSQAHSTLNVHSLNDIHNWMSWAANSVLTIWPS